MRGTNKPMARMSGGAIDVVGFGMGSAAATVVDLPGAIHPKAVRFLGNTVDFACGRELSGAPTKAVSARARGVISSARPPAR